MRGVFARFSFFAVMERPAEAGLEQPLYARNGCAGDGSPREVASELRAFLRPVCAWYFPCLLLDRAPLCVFLGNKGLDSFRE